MLQGDVAGVVVDVGAAVSSLDPGDEVYACAGGFKGVGNGALAEYMRADSALVARKPTSLSMREAAALPLVTLTAWEGIVARADVHPGDRVLIHGGTGGVGHVAVQLASAMGGIVHATAGTDEKRDLALQLGADHAIDYRSTSVEEYVDEYTAGDGFDVVYNAVGSERKNLQRSFEATRLNGNVVAISLDSTEDLSIADSRGLTLDIVYMLLPLQYGVGRERHGEWLSRAARLVDAKKLRPLLDESRFGFDEVADAHRRVESGAHVGKVTIGRD